MARCLVATVLATSLPKAASSLARGQILVPFPIESALSGVGKALGNPTAHECGTAAFIPVRDSVQSVLFTSLKAKYPQHLL